MSMTPPTFDVEKSLASKDADIDSERHCSKSQLKKLNVDNRGAVGVADAKSEHIER
jgi:hypothetical protein